MTILNRRTSKLRKVGNSPGLTIPAQILRDWGTKLGDQLVLYQLDGLLVVVPLAHLAQIGEPRLIRLLTSQT